MIIIFSNVVQKKMIKRAFLLTNSILLRRSEEETAKILGIK